MKLWDKGKQVLKTIEDFTVGRDREFDLLLSRFDVLGSIAHVKMLRSIQLLTKPEEEKLVKGLAEIYWQIINNEFKIEAGVEDIHSQVELILTRNLGETGKKIHSGRSRNDQVLLDIKLFIRNEIRNLTLQVAAFFNLLIELSEKNKEILIPGYTHLQVAMPSSFGLWFGAYAESLTDDLILLQAAYRVANQNPLGSAAGYGSSFPLNRKMTTELLGFEDLNYNSVYAQMTRGKTEKTVSFALSSIAATLSKMAADVCLFMSQNFGFVGFPDELVTGSSIMPHKKNPDVFELIRAKCNKIQAIPQQITLIMNNLPSGYFRDLQIIKEVFFGSFAELNSCIEAADIMFRNIIINKHIIEDEKYKYAFSVEKVNELVLSGIPFREAYQMVGKQIEEGNFKAEPVVYHTHEGSIGNLCNEEIVKKMNQIVAGFQFEKVERKLNELIK
ncbi:MAG: argininosuccinate lyase [Bacteroidales bacterium]